MYYGDLIASYKQVTYSDASITISLVFRTDGQVRESASLVTGKKDKMDTSLSRGFVCLDDRKKGPGDWTDCTVMPKPSLSSIHYKLTRG